MHTNTNTLTGPLSDLEIEEIFLTPARLIEGFEQDNDAVISLTSLEELAAFEERDARRLELDDDDEHYMRFALRRTQRQHCDLYGTRELFVW